MRSWACDTAVAGLLDAAAPSSGFGLLVRELFILKQIGSLRGIYIDMYTSIGVDFGGLTLTADQKI